MDEVQLRIVLQQTGATLHKREAGVVAFLAANGDWIVVRRMIGSRVQVAFYRTANCPC